MNLLNFPNRINLELSQIQSNNEEILSDLEKVAIFNSILILLTEELADSITFSIREKSKNREFTSWSYSLQDKNCIKRIGPDIEQIAAEVTGVSRDAYIDCQPKWSSRFHSMNIRRRAQVLGDTIWAEAARFSDQRNKAFQDNRDLPTNFKFDLHDLEVDLNKLNAVSKKLIGKELVKSVVDDTKEMLSKQYIVGIEIALIQHDKELLKWDFILRTNGSIVRQGHPMEQIIDIIKSLKRNPEIVVRPITSQQFNKMSPQDQELTMQNMVWATKFLKKPKRRLLPW